MPAAIRLHIKSETFQSFHTARVAYTDNVTTNNYSAYTQKTFNVAAVTVVIGLNQSVS